MKQMLHTEMPDRCISNDHPCDGLIVRTGWTYVSIDAHTWRCPSWTCQKCGNKFWSYFDTDNGDEGYDMDAEDEEDEE